ncbi:hypothetical protein EOK75_19525 (plasmid) [Pseudorhodobacter turbinis]|uniref:Uncharacterized protein n=1 Tax=Pseudorhodobacter turbinis TaxID=2500533 RepID=A0A4P8ELZ6_9RHOB|nr:hypothetical protein [Pseudorhodobacter turbinis]QCO57845.1 hypothetical protein EOK75_19525 [Pseudorhodobacter turbinis]
MFNAWKQEKATAALVDAANALSNKLAEAKSHFLESHAAFTTFWAATYLAQGQNLYGMIDWTPREVSRFVSKTQTKIAALRKTREYDSSDGLSVWLHTARAVSEPRIVSDVCDIWRQIVNAGPNAESMAVDLLQDAGLPVDLDVRAPKGFGTKE